MNKSVLSGLCYLVMRISAFTAFVCFGSVLYLYATVPAKVNYQGRYTINGIPQNGTKVFVFKIFDGVTEKWSSGNMNIAVSSGLFSVELTPTGIDWGSLSDPKIEVTAEGTVLTPQESLRSSIYALYASTAEYAASSGVGWTDEGTVVRLTNTSDNVVIASTLTVQGNAFSVGASTLVVINGNVGIGTTSPSRALDLLGNVPYAGYGTYGILLKNSWGPASVQIDGGTKNDAGVSGFRRTAAVDFKSGGTLRWGIGIHPADNSNTGLKIWESQAGDAVRLHIDAGGNVGIGATNPGWKTHIEEGSGFVYSFPSVDRTLNIQRRTTSINSNDDFVVKIFNEISPTASVPAKGYIALGADSIGNTSNSTSDLAGIEGRAYQYGSGSTNLTGVTGTAKNKGTAIVTNAASLYAQDLVNDGGGTITNAYGVFVEPITAGTNRYAIYAGGPQSYFDSKIGIGVLNPQGQLHVLSNSITDPYVFVTSHTVSGFGIAVTTNSYVGIGTINPQSQLQVSSGYIQFPTISGAAPAAADCDAAAEAGRVVVRTDGGINLYICTGAGGWVSK